MHTSWSTSKMFGFLRREEMAFNFVKPEINIRGNEKLVINSVMFVKLMYVAFIGIDNSKGESGPHACHIQQRDLAVMSH